MGRILKTYSRKHPKYKTKQPISVKKRDLCISFINVFHSTSQDTFDKLLKKDKIDEDSANIFTQPACISQISGSSRHFFTNCLEFMKNKKYKNSETESSSSILFKDAYSLDHLDENLHSKRQKTKKKTEERYATRRIKRKVLNKRKPLKDIQTDNLRNEDKSVIKCAISSSLALEDLQYMNLRSEDKRRQSEMKCVTSSSTPLIGKIPSNHAVIPLSPIMAVKKTLFHNEKVKNEELSIQVGNNCLSRKSKIEFFPYFKLSDFRQDKNKTYIGEESNFAQQKIDTEEKNNMNQKGSNQESKVNQQVYSPDFCSYFIEDKTDSMVSECCSASSKEAYNNKQDERDLEDVSDLDINKKLKQLSLSDSDKQFSHELFEDNIEKESNKEHNKPAQNQTFGNNNSDDYLINKDNILAEISRTKTFESQEVCKKQHSGNDQEHSDISYKPLGCENSDEWKPVEHNHEISKNQSKRTERESIKLKDVKENSEDVRGHITNIEEVDVNELTENNVNDREQDSFITLQPGKQWRRSLLIHRRNRRSLLNVRGEDTGNRFSVQPEQVIKVALNAVYSVNRRDSSSDFLHENMEKAWKCEKFNLKSYIIEEEDETDISIDSCVPPSSRSILNGLYTDVKDVSIHDENTISDDSRNKWRKSFSYNNESGFRGFSSEIINTDTVSTNVLDNESDFGSHSVHTDGLECNDDQPMVVQKVILDICEQDRLIPFEEFFYGREHKECRKLGEGTYGEVFLLRSEDESVLKIIPVEGRVIVNGENQKTFLEVFF